MRKKDYLLIAKVIKYCREHGAQGEGVEAMKIDMKNTIIFEMANKLADSLKKDNPKFDRVKFLMSCGCLPYRELLQNLKIIKK